MALIGVSNYIYVSSITFASIAAPASFPSDLEEEAIKIGAIIFSDNPQCYGVITSFSWGYSGDKLQYVTILVYKK